MSDQDQPQEPQSIVEFLSQPWRDRRLFVVVKDGGLPAKAIPDVVDPDAEDASWVDRLRNMDRDQAEELAMTAGRVGAAFYTLGLSEVGLWGWRRLRGKRDSSDDLRLTKVSIDALEFAQELELIDKPYGGFDYNTVYTGHPHIAKNYFPMARFHHFLFEDKAAELYRILEGLGARWFMVRHTIHKRQQHGLSTALSYRNLNLGGDVSNVSEESGLVSWRVTYSPRHQPYLPQDLIWYHGERSWQNLVRARMEADLQTFQIDLSYEQNYQIDGDLAVSLEKLGFNLGGSFIDYERVVWYIEGEFAPKHTLSI